MGSIQRTCMHPHYFGAIWLQETHIFIFEKGSNLTPFRTVNRKSLPTAAEATKTTLADKRKHDLHEPK